MQLGRRLLLAGFPISLLVIYACSSDSDSGAPSIDLDAGSSGLVESSTVTPPANDSATPVGGDDSGTDSGTVVAKGPITTCAPLVPLSSKRAGLPLSVGSFNGKYLFGYGLPYTESSDGSSHMLGRYFDGTSFGPEIDFGTDGEEAAFSSVDATGKEFLLHLKGGGVLDRVVFDLTTGMQLPSRPGAPFGSDDTNYTVGGLPQGALAMFGSQTPPGATISRYQNDLWDNSDGGANDAGDAGFYAETKDPVESGVALNAAGKGAIWWLSPENAAGAYTLTVLPFDGTSFKAPTTRTFMHSEELFTAAALSNGDVEFGWLGLNSTTAIALFHADTGQFDADDPLTNGAFGNGGPLVLADANDNITALWVGSNGYTMRRRVGGTWTSDIAITQTTYGSKGVVDPSGNVVVIAFNEGGLLLTRVAPDATTIGDFVATGQGGSNLAPVVAFNAAGDPVVLGYSAAGDGILSTTTCSTSH